MSNELAKPSSELLPLDAAKLGQFLDVMGLGNKLSDNEKKQFFEISQAFGLNPFKREIYCTKYGDQLSIIVGYETYIKRAERSGKLDGWQVVTEGKPEDNSLKAIITIHRNDRKFPFVHEVYYSEYVQKVEQKIDGKGTGKYIPNKFWQKAYTMTKKVAMAQGFRLCFSDELGGMPYAQEELEASYELVDDIKPVHTQGPKTPEPIPDATKAINDDISTEQVTKISELLKSEFIVDKERKKISIEMTTYTSKRAVDCINWLKTEIKNREEITKQQKDESTKS